MKWFENLRGGWLLNLKGRGSNPMYNSEHAAAYSSMINGTTEFNDYSGDMDKIRVIFSNPAVLKVFKLQCDLFSLGKFYIYDDNDVLIKGNDPAIDRLDNPNPFQDTSQWLWDAMFWNMCGTDRIWTTTAVATDAKMKLYHLEPHKITFPESVKKAKDKFIISEASEKDLFKQQITYKYEDGSTIQIALKDIMTFSDLTNGTGNWFKSNSVLDSLYKVISNLEAGLDAKNINTRYAGKFIVAGMADPDNVTQMPMDEEEKLSIEQKVNGHKSVHAVKTMVDIKRFIEDLGSLRLDESYLADYFIIGSLFNIPRDVLEAYKSSTFENQEKARGAHVSYTLEPKGSQLAGKLTKRFGYNEKGKKIVLSWDHLPFMQIFAKDKATTNKSNAETLLLLMKAGVPVKEINAILDTEFTELDYESAKAKPETNSGQAGGDIETNQ